MTKIRTFKTKEEAQALIDGWNNGAYSCRHGEYSRPDCKVRKIRSAEAYGIYIKYYYLSGTFGAKRNGFLTWEDCFKFGIN